MTTAPGSPAYRRIAASLAEAFERQHERLAPLSDGNEPQMKQNSDATQKRPAPTKRRSHKRVILPIKELSKENNEISHQ